MSKRYRKIAQTLTISMALRLLLITCIASAIVYWHVHTTVTNVVTQDLEKYIRVRGERESQVFLDAEEDQVYLSRRMIELIEENDAVSRDARFNEVFTLGVDGSVHEKQSIDNNKHPSLMIPSKFGMSLLGKRRAVLYYDFLDRDCSLSLSSFSNCWLLMTDGTFGVLYPQSQGYTDDLVKDFRKIDHVIGAGVGPSEDIDRRSHWSKIYFDQHIKKWMVTLATPIYKADHFLGTLGNDIIMGELLGRTIHFGLDGTHNFIIDGQGNLITHPLYESKIREHSNAIVAKDLSHDPDVVFAASVIESRVDLNKQAVFESGDALVAITRLSGPDWYLGTIYPKSLLMAASAKAGEIVFLIGLIILAIEVMVLLWLLKNHLEKPLRHFMQIIQRVTKGDLQAKAEIRTGNELEILSDAFNEMTYNLDVSQTKLNQAVVQAVEASKVKSQFVANMGHELRTPLSGILGFSDFLKGTALTEEQRRYANLINTSGSTLLAIVNQILEFSNNESARFVPKIDVFKMEDILREVTDSCYFASREKGIPLQVINNLNTSLELQGDSTRLRQVLINLVGNALKFSKVGVVKITVDASELNPNTIQCRFSIRDQGPGISADVQAALFQPFVQGDDSNTRQYGGAGLGLALSKSFVEMMDGEIGVNSQLGDGAEFWFTAKFFSSANKKSSGKVEESKLNEFAKGTLPVLLVEDTPLNVMICGAFIESIGLKYVVASNGVEAVAQFSPGKFSAILMDCQMPVMDGYEATRQIRALEKGTGCSIPIIAVTAKSASGDKEKCLESGMNDMLSKPVTATILKEKIQYWLKKKVPGPVSGRSVP